jgi:hypothetical protein
MKTLAIEEQCLLSAGQPTKGCFEFLALALEEFEKVIVLSTERGRANRQLGTLEHCWRRETGGQLPRPIVVRLAFEPFRPAGSVLVAKDSLNYRGRLPLPSAILPTLNGSEQPPTSGLSFREVSQESVETPTRENS